MRPPLVLSLLTILSFLAAVPVSALQPLTPEMPLTAPQFGPADGSREPIAVASSGEIGLVVWRDSRESRYAISATRVSSSAVALDPLGIPLGFGRAAFALWNGTEFVVLARHGESSRLIFVTLEGVVREEKTIDLPGVWQPFAASQRGAAPRFLFLTWGAAGTRIAVVDGTGNVMARDVALPVAEGFRDHRWSAGSGDDDFLVLRMQVESAGSVPADRVVADRITLDGTLISSSETGIRNTYLEQASPIAGDGAGYVLVTGSSYVNAAHTIYPLDRNGVWRGHTVSVPEAPPPPTVASRLTRDGDHLLLTWTSGLDGRAHSISYIAAVKVDGTVTSARGILYEPGYRPPPAVARIGSNLIVFYGSAAVRLDEAHAPKDHSLLAFSGVPQTGTAVAAGSNGWLAGWVEGGRGVVRRLSPSGAPIDGAPLPVADSGSSITIVSSGSTYLIAMQTHGGTRIRRLSEPTGEWLDPEAVLLSDARSVVALAANGESALMAWSASCAGQNADDCVKVRTISMNGPLTLSEPVVLHMSVSQVLSPGDVVIAASGQEHLIAWTEGQRFCPILCAPERWFVRAMRVRTDGTAIDPAPIVLHDATESVWNTNIAWDGASYLLNWNNGRQVMGARVTSDGAVSGVENGRGTILDDSDTWDAAFTRMVAHGDGVVLFVRRNVGGNAPHQVWRAVTIPATVELDTVKSLPRREIVFNEGTASGMLGAASRGSLLLVTYDRIDMSVGGVPRGFLRMYTDEARRRAVRR